MPTCDILEDVGHMFVAIPLILHPVTSTFWSMKHEHLGHINQNKEATDIVALIILLALTHLADELAGENRVLEFVETGHTLEHTGTHFLKALLAGEGHGTEVIGVLGVN